MDECRRNRGDSSLARLLAANGAVGLALEVGVRMRRVVAALVVCLGLAVPACALALVVETGANVDQELVGLKTTDGLRIKDADCRPQGKSFSIVDSKLASPLWTCYVSDGLGRVYNVTAHVRNASAPAISAAWTG